MKTPAGWTLLGGIVVDKLRLNSNKLELWGHRTIIAFDDAGKTMKWIKWSEKVSIEVPTGPGADQAGQLHSELNKVFIAPGDEMVAVLPDYWQDYMTRFFGKHTKGEPCPDSALAAEPDAPQESKPAVGITETPAPVQVSAGIAEGYMVHRVAPNYLMVARQAGVEGKVSLRARVSKTGEVVKVCLTHALGAGIDDEAVNTVRQWKYSPYLLNGEPIEIKTSIDLSFHMH